MISPFSSYCQECEEDGDAHGQEVWEPKAPNVLPSLLKLCIDTGVNSLCLFPAGSGSHHIRHQTPFSS